MKNLTSLVATILIPLLLTAQDAGDANKFKVTFGPNFELPKKFVEVAYLGNPKDGFLQISVKGDKEMRIQQFSPTSLALSKETIIDLKDMPSGFMIDWFKQTGNKYLMFYSTWDKERKKEQLSVKEVDVKKGIILSAEKKILESNQVTGTLVTTGLYQFAVADKFEFNTSKDSSKILVTYRIKPTVKDDNVNKDVLGFHVYDKDLNKLWGKEFKMPYTEAIMDNEDFEIDSEGNAYLLAKVYEGTRKEKEDDQPNYHYELLKFTKDATTPQKIPISLTDKFINELYIAEHLSNSIVCAGYYSTNANSRSADGVFLIKIDATGKTSPLHKGYYEIPTNVLKQFKSEKEQEKIDSKSNKKEKEVSNLELRNIVLSDDGSVIVNGEQYKVVSYTYFSNGEQRTKTTYYYDDIISMKISHTGSIEWIRKIPKRQKGSQGTGGMSYKYFAYNGNNYFFYIDNIKNLSLGFDQEPATHLDGAGGFFTVCKIDPEGLLSKGKLFDLRQKDVTLEPTDLDKMTSTILFGRARQGKEYKAIKIQLNP